MRVILRAGGFLGLAVGVIALFLALRGGSSALHRVEALGGLLIAMVGLGSDSLIEAQERATGQQLAAIRGLARAGEPVAAPVVAHAPVPAAASASATAAAAAAVVRRAEDLHFAKDFAGAIVLYEKYPGTRSAEAAARLVENLRAAVKPLVTRT